MRFEFGQIVSGPVSFLSEVGMGSAPVGKIGKYDVVGIIGEGGMGIVYKAVDPLLGRMVAIKKITAAFTEGSDLQKRFYFEARAVASLQHPNIVVVFDMGEEGGCPFLVMEYLTGESLATIIATRQELPLLRKIDIVIQICHALHYAHEHDLVHRDVKPANVIVMPNGRAKLLDFGIAHAANKGLTRTGQVLGTINYISPEQLSNSQVDARTDVFSAGVVLYQLLTYQLPFEAPHTAAIINRILHEPPPPLSAFLPDYPTDLDEILERALAKAPADRYPSADEMSVDLIRLFDRLKRDTLSEYIKHARACIAEANMQAAHDVLDAALKLDTKHAMAKQLMYEVEQVMGKQQVRQQMARLAQDAEAAMREKKLDEALSMVEEALAQDKTDTQLLSLRDQIVQAKVRKDRVCALLHLSDSAQQAGELPMAQKAVEDALELDPDDTQAKVLHASLLGKIEAEHKHRHLRDLLAAVHQQISARKFDAASDLIRQAEQVDASSAEIVAVKTLVETGQQQELRRQEIEAVCTEIQDALSAGDVVAACMKAERANRKYPNEPDLVKIKALAEHGRDEQERNHYVEERIAEAKRLREDGELNSALKLIQRASQRYPGESRLQFSLDALRAEAESGKAKQITDEALQKADGEIGRNNLDVAVRVLETAAARVPNAAELNEKLLHLRDELAGRECERKVAAIEKKIAQLLQQNDYSRARLILERAAAELGDQRLTALRPHIEQELAVFTAIVVEIAAKAQRMLDDGRLDEAAFYIATQPGTYEQVPEFAEIARLISERQDLKRTCEISVKKVRAAERTAVTSGAALSELAEHSGGVSATAVFESGASLGQQPVTTTIAPQPATKRPVVASTQPQAATVAKAKATAETPRESASDPKTKRPARPANLRWIMIVAGILIVAAVAVVGFRHRSAGSHIADTYVAITAVPWGTVKTITSASGEVINVNQETPARVSLSPGDYTVVIIAPSGAEQTGKFVVRDGPNVYRHVCEEIDVQKIVESY